MEDLIKLLKEAANARSERVAISTNKVNGLLTLTVGNGWEVLLTDGLLMLLGLDKGLGGNGLMQTCALVITRSTLPPRSHSDFT